MIAKKLLTIAGAIAMGAVLTFGTLSGAAKAKNFPEKPVTLIVPFGPGGGTDTLARAIAPLWEEHLGQKIIVVNRPGGSGVVGVRSVLETSSDGYTVVMYQPPQVNLAVEYQQAPFELSDIKFINLLTKDDALFFTGTGNDWNSIEDVITAAKERPGEIKVGIALSMGMDYLYVKELEEKAGVEFGQIIPVGSGGDLLREVMGGHIDIGVSGAWVARNQKGSIQPLAVRSVDRSPIWPDTPTVNEVVDTPYSAEEIAGSAPSYKGIAIPASVAAEHPERFNKLASSFETMLESEAFAALVDKQELETTISYVGPDGTDAVIATFSSNLSRFSEYFTKAASGQ
ncbi:tripartite tricarboxylate transporter substrate binding protein [Epibacterium sp. Ofav1-8]|uniref:tripartite tricarboxylate transporter substrate binding protein n=1 Tax=Epibacterium sp. Ofav1-8 TaxID=2917735 RepID=UPI001EF4778C|nr:tripartite tricarboxylate transporter substrate binding protein [Epibacterium sp. Ofav1-8]MCG7626134.1 tripartite tricarboxylate transporter substrate binding protein [Epibacterium sp. Ofav1-8]